MPRLAFCVFAKQLHAAWNDDGVIIPIGNNRVETVLFDVLSVVFGKNACQSISAVKVHDQGLSNCIIIPAGPAPFTQLRILRATQLGLASGLKRTALMVNMFDVLFSVADIKTGSCLLETRRGDYFSQTRQDGAITDERIVETISKDRPVISDDPKLSTFEITQNLAKTMLTNNFYPCENLIYGIELPYSTKGMII